MAEAEPLVIEGVTTSQYAQMVERAKAAGIAITGNSGTAQKYGAAIAYEYQPDTQVLRLECTKVPFFLTKNEVYGRLRTLMSKA